MKKQYWCILLTYLLMQLSSTTGVNFLLSLGIGLNHPSIAEQIAISYWSLLSFTVALIIVLFLLRSEMNMRQRYNVHKITLWSISGLFMALAAQSLAIWVEVQFFGIEPGSQNTEMLIKLITKTPFFIIVVAIIGPILEEIIFRMIIFGTFVPKFGFFLSAIFSSVMFGAFHMEFQHIILYTSMGLVFSFLYVKTKQILVPIFAHVMMNTIVIIGQIGLF
ncbi:CPBP family intramembrane glutamic endopeptidase [Peribacillus frigoritolerans]|uniref:CPBP family intramembrane glutamic endopeptidase n=1 Tax=Peribacillus frigoritolerans TaxID=450367 RepID=UPI0007BFE599|nr:type II CAAX endopeptidase family protein [Peribacillus frigoritolerans]USK65633.1 CPBP family intramembrane metalloprotease [Peribacillus frigoritolerans]